MKKIKQIILNEPVTFNGAIIQAGEVLELSELSAKALVEEGKGEEVTAEENQNPPEGTEVTEEGGKAKEDLRHSENKEDGAGDDTALVVKALEDKYNRDPLAEAAKGVGVEFAFNAKKGEIIQAVIQAGKAEVLLQK
ncbi:DUF7210 family protein [Cytobacillus kochii]|uniref:DUF7210 family protein n=1 Tax=Cytobacillus kochii TaxID=859143 RepID=UPI00402AE69A